MQERHEILCFYSWLYHLELIRNNFVFNNIVVASDDVSTVSYHMLYAASGTTTQEEGQLKVAAEVQKLRQHLA